MHRHLQQPPATSTLRNQIKAEVAAAATGRAAIYIESVNDRARRGGVRGQRTPTGGAGAGQGRGIGSERAAWIRGAVRCTKRLLAERPTFTKAAATTAAGSVVAVALALELRRRCTFCLCVLVKVENQIEIFRVRGRALNQAVDRPGNRFLLGGLIKNYCEVKVSRGQQRQASTSRAWRRSITPNDSKRDQLTVAARARCSATSIYITQPGRMRFRKTRPGFRRFAAL